MKKGKIVQFYFFVAIFIIGIVIVVNSITVNETKKPSVSVAKPKSKNIGYQVYLVQNDAVPEEYLDKDRLYVAKLIDYIKLNYNIEYDIKDEISYNVTGKLDVDYVSTGNLSVKPTLAEREYTFIPNTVADSKKINTDLKLDYMDYNYEFAQIKDSLGVGVKGELKIIFSVNNCSNNKNLFTDTITIPLGEDVFSIADKSTEVTVTTSASEDSVKVDTTELIVGILIILLGGFKAFSVADKSFNLIKENYYTTTLAKILKNYGDIIAEMMEPMDLRDIRVSDVRNFNQLLDVEEETRSPINFYEVRKREEGHFVIIHNNIGYRYILKNNSKNKGKRSF